MRYEEFIKKTVEEYTQGGTIPGEAFPDMELYMDQAVLFLNKHLDIYSREPKEPVITKTMVSNYAKHGMIPRPVNKKYTRDHLLLLAIIFYLKGIFGMQEIELLMRPFMDNYNSEFDEKFDFLKIYNSILKVCDGEKERLSQQVFAEMGQIKDALQSEESGDDDATEMFMLAATLAIKADAQKYVAQKLLNEYFAKPKRTKEKPREKVKEKEKPKEKMKENPKEKGRDRK